MDFLIPDAPKDSTETNKTVFRRQVSAHSVSRGESTTYP